MGQMKELYTALQDAQRLVREDQLSPLELGELAHVLDRLDPIIGSFNENRVPSPRS